MILFFLRSSFVKELLLSWFKNNDNENVCRKERLIDGNVKTFFGQYLWFNIKSRNYRRGVLVSAKTDLEKNGFLPRVENQLMLTFRGNAINRTLTNTISKFYANLYNTTSGLLLNN